MFVLCVRRSAALVQLVRRVFVNAQVHREVRLFDVHLLMMELPTLGRRPAQQALVDQGLHHVHHRRGFLPRREIQHRFCRLQREAAFEHRTLRQRCLLPERQQLPAPVDGGFERDLSCGCAFASGQQLEAVLQPQHELLWRQDADARCRQLDGQRQPVEQFDDPCDGGAVAVVHDKIRLLRTRPHGKQFDGFGLQRQRLDGEDFFALQMQPLAAGGEECRLCGAVDPAAQRGWGMRDDLLEVVQDHQAAPAPGDGVAQLRAVVVLAQRYAQGQRHGKVDAFQAARFAQVAEVDAAGPVAEPGAAVAAHGAGLAGAAHTHQREQPAAAVQALCQFAQFAAAADEGVAFGGQVVAHFAQRQPKLLAEHHAVGFVAVGRRCEGVAVAAEFEDRDRRVNTFEPVMAVVFDQAAFGQGREGVARALAHQGLAAARQRHDARGQRLGQAFGFDGLGAARDLPSRVAAQDQRADMQAYPRGQTQLVHGLVVGVGITRGLGDVGKDQEEAVAAVDLLAAMCNQQLTRAAVVCDPQRRGLHITQPLQQRRAGDHIGEEQRVLVHRRADEQESSTLAVLGDQRLGRFEQRTALEATLVHIGHPFIVDAARQLDELLRLGGREGVERIAPVHRRFAANGIIALLRLAQPA